MFDPKQEDFISSRKEIFIMKTVHTDKAPAAIGPYSQAIIHGDTLYTSGQIPVDPATGEVVGTTIEEQFLRQQVPAMRTQSRPYASLQI